MIRTLLLLAVVPFFAATALAQSGGTTLYNGITLPAPWPPSQTPNQNYNVPTYITSPPAVIDIDTGRQLFVDDFLIQQTTLSRTQHQPVMYPLNPIIVPDQNDTSGYAMPFSGGAWYDPSSQLYKIFLFCGGAPAMLCSDYSSDGIHWTRPSLPDAMVPNTDEVLPTALTVWMDLQDPNPQHRYKAFVYAPNSTDYPVLLYFSPDGFTWTATAETQYPIPLVYDRTSFFWNPYRNVWVDSLKNYLTVPAAPSRAAYLTRLRNYAESPDLMNWIPLEPANFGTSFWTGPDVNDSPYVAGGTFPQLYNLDAVAYESVMVGLFSWYYPGFNDDNPGNLPGPDLVELGVGFSRDGFQWVRPTRGSGPGPNGAFIPASNVAGTWNMGNTQSAGGCFLVVGDQLWFYFSGFNGLHGDASAMASTGLATLRRDGFYSMDAGSTPAVLTTRPVQFSGKSMFVNVTDPQGSLQIQVIDPSTSAVLATSQPLSVDKTLQAVSWNGLADLSSFANTPVEFQFTLTNGELYSFWVSSSTSGASNGYVAAGGPGFTGVTDTLGSAAYPTVAATPLIYPAGGIVSNATNITITSNTLGATIYYTLDGTNPIASSPVYTGPLHLAANATVQAMASAPGLTNSAAVSASFTVDNTPPAVTITSPTNNQTVSATINVTANASDSVVGIANVQLLIDGVSVGTLTSAPYALSVQTTTLTNASHVITAIATNNIGTQTTSSPITVTVQNVFTGPTVGLVGYWSFDSEYVNGTTLYDQSGYNNNATSFSALSVPGEVGQALHFDGSSSYVQVTSSITSQQLYDLVGNLSLSLWIQTTNSTRTETLISKLNSGGVGSGYILRTTALGNVQLAFGVSNVSGGSNVATDVTKINDGNWHQVTAVIELGTSVTFYIDGAFSSSYTINSVAGGSNTQMQLGLDPYPPNGTYFTGNMDEVRIYNRALSANDVIALGSGLSNVPTPSGSAVFVQTDTTTQGNWIGTYGSDGNIITNSSNNPPSYAQIAYSNANSYTWTTATTDPRALLLASGSGRIASATYSGSAFTIDLNFTDGQAHQLALYCLDWDNSQRSETISILDAGTQAVLDRRTISNFSAGEYLVWNIIGNVLITVNDNTGPNAVVSGIFFEPLPGPDLTIKKTHTGTFKPGDVGDTYTITVTNSGSNATTGAVSVTDTVPQGLTATGISGTAWTCTQPFGPCTRSDALNPGASYLPITLTVNVATSAPSNVTNTATVSGGGETDSSNDTATDPTVIATPSNGQPFVTAYGLDNPVLRNDFSGWVGMELTIGANPLTVSAIGRVCVAGNSGTHMVKFTNATTATDVAGGSVTLNMGGCTAGQFLYANLSAAITLQPNTAYYLSSQESSGGDRWYDHGVITPTPAAAVNNSIYSSDSAAWVAADTANSSYVPPNFTYSVTPPITIPITVQTSPSNLSITVDGTTYSTAQVFNWIVGSTHSIGVASPQAGQTGAQYVWTTWSDNGALSHTVVPSAAITYTATFATQYLLTTSVPGSGGSITLNPPSSSGYYDSAANVQVTAAPSPNCTFASWGGALSGSFSPLTITMSSAQSVSAMFQCSGPSSTTFLTAYGLDQPPVRNNYTGWVGFEFTTAASSLSVTSLGRVCVAGNSSIHTVKFVSGAGTDLAGGSVLVNMAGCTNGQFVYSSLTSPIALQANTTYYLTSQEAAGGDQWYDHGTVSSTAAASVSNSIYSTDSADWITASGSNTSYVPPNFQYSIVVPPPDLTVVKSHSGTFTQGDAGDTYAITVSNVGGSATTSAVLVADSIPAGLTATAISGSGWSCIQPAGPCSRSDALNNGNSYSPIAVTVNVASNSPTSVTNVATVSGGGETNTSNDTASDVTSITALVSVTVQTSPPGLSFTVDQGTYTSSQVFQWIAGSSHTISASSPQSGGAGVQYVWSGWSDSGAISHSVFPVNATTFTASFGLQYQLVASASPSLGGTITASPASSIGYYPAGTPVQLTAAPNSNYAFASWGGDLSGSANSQTITMSAPQSVTANFELLSTAITSYAQGGALRNNFTGWAGTSLTVGANPLNVALLGRVCASGNSGTHVVKFVRAASGDEVPDASATVDMAGCTAGQFVYASVSVTLQAGVTYYVVSQELSGGDYWYDDGAVTPSGDISLNGGMYLSGTTWIQAATGNTSYIPPNFKYVVLPPAASSGFIIDYNLNQQSLRNNFTGYVGLQFTVGATPLTISSLGRVCVTGNSGTHTVEVVNASTGVVIAGGQVTVNMSGCTADQFVFTSLRTPITLAPNASYYLATQEFAGGDQWYDYATVRTTSSAAVTSAVYSFDGVNWSAIGAAGMSYVPPSFQ